MLRVGVGRSALGPIAVQPPAGSSPPPVTCAFPLSNAGLGGFGYAAPTMSNGDQTASAVLASGTNLFGAASFTQTVAADTGTRIVRLVPDTLPLFAADGSEGNAAVKLGLYGAGPAEVAGMSIIATVTGTYQWVAIGAGSVVVDSGTLASLPAFIDMRLRSADGLYDISLPDGTPLAADLVYVPEAVNPLLAISGQLVAAGGIGRTITCTFVTDAASLANSPFADGVAMDACGNPIDED